MFRSALGLALGASAARVEVEVNPIRRIVTLLQNMQKEVKHEGEKEEELYNKFMCFCSGNTDQLQKSIDGASSEAKALAASAQEKQARKEQLDQELVEHKASRTEAKATIAKATKIRETEHAEYEQNAGDSKANIEALTKGINALERGMGKALLQMTRTNDRIKSAVAASISVTDMEKENVLSFLASPYGDYAPASGEIVGILKTMKDQMDKDLGGIIEVEEAAQKSFDELVAAKTAEIKAASAAIESKSVRSGQLAVEVVQDKNAAENADKETAANADFLANLERDCKTKTAEWDERVATRNDELLAISQAIKVLNDDDALDIFKKTLPSPASPAPVFLQRVNDVTSRKAEAFAWIQSASTISESRPQQLALLASLLRAGKVDFAVVLKMIDDMVAHLGKEQKTDVQQKEWCNKEFDAADDSKKALTRKVSDLTSEIDDASARAEQLKDEIASLQSKIAELDEAVAEATKQRKEEHTEFVQTSSELTAAKQLLDKAKNRLNKFYNPMLYKKPPTRELTEEERIATQMGEDLPAEPIEYIAGTNIPVHSFLQIDAKPEPQPDTWSAGGYKKKGQKSGGVIALMDMMIKDVDTQMLEGKKDEESAQASYEKLMSDSAATRETDSKSLVNDKSALAETNSRINEAKQERAAKVTEVEGLLKEIANLHASCDFLIQNFDFRKEARAKETDALKNAKAVLSGADYA